MYLRVYKLLDPTEVRLQKEWVGGAKGPIEKPSVVVFFPGATFRGNWGNSPRNGHVADPFLPVWVQGREAPSGLEY